MASLGTPDSSEPFSLISDEPPDKQLRSNPNPQVRGRMCGLSHLVMFSCGLVFAEPGCSAGHMQGAAQGSRVSRVTGFTERVRVG